MIATPHSLASSVGLNTLRAGGSAVDAAISANAALCATYLHMTGLGGDGFWMISSPDDEVTAINASGPAAGRATREYYTEKGYEEIPERGPEAALTVPGAVDGWRLAHERYGRLPWEDLLEDAIDMAREGVPVTTKLARWIRATRDVLIEDDGARATFLPDGNLPRTGDRLRQRDLADSLSAVAELGAREGFYDGDLAERICSALAEDGSPLRVEDFSEYRAEWVDPLSVEYRGYTAHGFPPNTQGLTALQLLGMLDTIDATSWGDGTVDYYHHLAEATKVAFGDKNAWITDPDFVDIPTGKLLSESYLSERRKLIDSDTAMASLPGPGIAPSEYSATTESAGGDTCYTCIGDEDGLAVSVIQSVYFEFGSGVLAGNTGVIPQNRGSFFSLEDTHVNRLEPGKRTFHTLIPAMLTEDGDPRLVYGTMGG